MPNVVNLLNGMFSLVKYGLSDCNGGFSTNPGFGVCSDNGLYERSYGHLLYEPSGASDHEQATDLALLLTAGRLSDSNLDIIVDACSAELNNRKKTQCMLQLIVTTAEFHSTSTVTKKNEETATETRIQETAEENSSEPMLLTGEFHSTRLATKRSEESITETTNTVSGRTDEEIPKLTSLEPYKAIVYFYLSGGLDSYQMLAPHTCAPIDVYNRYRIIRGKTAISEGVGLPLERLLEIPANNPDQPCSSFGIHESLPILKTLFDEGKLNFIANAGLLAKPVSVENYRGETPVQLFAHNAMSHQTKREDIMNKFAGTGRLNIASVSLSAL